MQAKSKTISIFMGLITCTVAIISVISYTKECRTTETNDMIDAKSNLEWSENANDSIQSVEEDNIQQNLEEQKINDNSDENQNTLSSTQYRMVYPEWVYLSEYFSIAPKIYSPIDHDYNIRASNQDFIGDAADEFIHIWMQELEYQYDQCLKIMPEELKDCFIKQQLAWLEYDDIDVFNYICGSYGWGFVRAWKPIRMNRIRERTLDIMNIIALIGGADIEFSYVSMENE